MTYFIALASSFLYFNSSLARVGVSKYLERLIPSVTPAVVPVLLGIHYNSTMNIIYTNIINRLTRPWSTLMCVCDRIDIDEDDDDEVIALALRASNANNYNTQSHFKRRSTRRGG